MKCPELETEVIRSDNDFYFLRDNLLKLYPATVVRLYFFFILLYYINRYLLYLIDQYLIISNQKKQII